MDKVKEVLNRIYEEQPEKIKGLGGDKIPDVRQTLARFRAAVGEQKEERTSADSVNQADQTDQTDQTEPVNRPDRAIRNKSRSRAVLSYAAGFCVLIAVSVFVYSYMILPGLNTDGTDPTVGVTNPMREVADIAEAERLAGFKVETPGYMPDGYITEGIFVTKIDKESINVRQCYVNGRESRIYFDKTLYAHPPDDDDPAAEGYIVERIYLEGTELCLLYQDETLMASIWRADGFEYRVSATDGVEKDEMIRICSSIE